jgi:hypothetical protein
MYHVIYIVIITALYIRLCYWKARHRRMWANLDEYLQRINGIQTQADDLNSRLDALQCKKPG